MEHVSNFGTHGLFVAVACWGLCIYLNNEAEVRNSLPICPHIPQLKRH